MRVGLLAGLLVLTLGSGVVAQSPSPEPPPWFGGRVEMPEHGFAVIVPDGWVAFDVSVDADIDAQVEAAQAALSTYDLGLMRESLGAAAAEGAHLNTIEGSELVGERQPHGRSCWFGVVSSWFRPLDTEFAADLYEGALSRESFVDVEPPTPVDLAVGSGWALVMSGQSPHYPDEWFPVALYLVEGDAGAFMMSCSAVERPDDDWLSIAETFEFLLAEE